MALGVRVEFTDLRHLRRNGDYCHELRLIRLQDGLLPRKLRHVYAHELGHATHRDEPSMFSAENARQERRADEWAAHFLIDADEYREAEERHAGKIDAMAVDLYVLERTIIAYQRTLQRIGDTVYVHPRYGFGQWSDRYEVA
ncbi:ImmA/IrrE family metallo-endopeptidase [Leucobacter sp. NPDC077196]|uniref:ImmA/IrrE family metallo-endopeptidase n=1 Tax=Leucobacter sp. NPDC077196 TaxID=3154959 RepID=UPI0034144892